MSELKASIYFCLQLPLSVSHLIQLSGLLGQLSIKPPGYGYGVPYKHASFGASTNFVLGKRIKLVSQVCQNYQQDCEDAVNKQINMELNSSYVYLSMSYYFDRDDVALRHFAEFFKEQSHEEREHAEKLLEFQNRRGGRIILADIKKPEQDKWSNGVEVMQRALQMEKNVNQSLLDLHKLSTGSTDPHLCDFLETHYLDEQVKMIKQLGDHITNLKRLGAPENGQGEYLFDKHTLGESD
uniref:ferritin heavy chain B-like n=1 Tax=Pristiophorus japonicus TaxID=55135 RepID=UPI00398E42E7